MAAPDWADVSEDRQLAVSRLRFTLLGYAHAWLRSRGQHLVHEVWVSPDRLSQAVMTGSEQLELVTLFEDGTVIKTILRPDLATWLFMAPGMRAHSADRHSTRSVAGEPADVFRRHVERIEQHEQQHGVRPVPVESMCVHFATRIRARDLLNARFAWHFTIAHVMGGVGAFVAVIAVNVRGMLSHGPDFPTSWRAIVLAAPLAMIATLLSYGMGLWFIAPTLVRLRPGPPPLPAAELMDRAQQVERRPLPDESEW
jgi:hypothetical protein